MSMSKKDFIALADALRAHDPATLTISDEARAGAIEQRNGMLDAIVRFCRSQNPAFKEDRWRDYLAGKCGPNGGKRA